MRKKGRRKSGVKGAVHNVGLWRQARAEVGDVSLTVTRRGERQ